MTEKERVVVVSHLVEEAFQSQTQFEKEAREREEMLKKFESRHQPVVESVAKSNGRVPKRGRPVTANQSHPVDRRLINQVNRQKTLDRLSGYLTNQLRDSDR